MVSSKTSHATPSPSTLLSYGGDPVNGSFTKTYNYMPNDALTYRACAYIGQSTSGPYTLSLPDALPICTEHASASINFSSDPVEDKYSTVTVSGSTEVYR